MKILLSNFGYGSAGDGKYMNYITNFLQSTKKEHHSMQALEKVIAENDPDIICLSEIKKKHVEGYTFEKIPYYVNGGIKYNPQDKLGKYILGHHRFNAVLTREKYKTEIIYLSYGNKKLIYKIFLGSDTFLYFGHFSLRQSIRKKQFSELAQLINPAKSNIVCGDFNIFKGESELESLCDMAGLKIADSNPTFPSHNPMHKVDIFLVSEHIDIHAKILPNIFSDHLALIAELDLDNV